MTTRAFGLAAAIVLAAAGLLPCLCAGMAPAAAVASHCGAAEPTGPGLTAAHQACACTCMSAAESETTVARVEPAFAAVPAAVAVPPFVRQASHPVLAPTAPADLPRAAPLPALRI